MKVTVNYQDGKQEVIDDIVDHLDLPDKFMLKQKRDMFSSNIIYVDKDKLKSVKFSGFNHVREQKNHKKYFKTKKI